MEYRIAHSRFNGSHPVGKTDDFTRVVTSVWDFNPGNRVLTYGATVFKRTIGDSHWTRRKHKDRALERFHNNPVRVVLDFPPGFEVYSIAIDWFIATKLVFEYGTHIDQPPEKFPTVYTPDNFNEIYRLSTPYNENFYQDEQCYIVHLDSCWFALGFCVAILGGAACQYFL